MDFYEADHRLLPSKMIVRIHQIEWMKLYLHSSSCWSLILRLTIVPYQFADSQNSLFLVYWWPFYIWQPYYGKCISTPYRNIWVIFFDIHLIICYRQLSSIDENIQTGGAATAALDRYIQLFINLSIKCKSIKILLTIFVNSLD